VIASQHWLSRHLGRLQCRGISHFSAICAGQMCRWQRAAGVQQSLLLHVKLPQCVGACGCGTLPLSQLKSSHVAKSLQHSPSVHFAPAQRSGAVGLCAFPAPHWCCSHAPRFRQHCSFVHVMLLHPSGASGFCVKLAGQAFHLSHVISGAQHFLCGQLAAPQAATEIFTSNCSHGWSSQVASSTQHWSFLHSAAPHPWDKRDGFLTKPLVHSAWDFCELQLASGWQH